MPVNDQMAVEADIIALLKDVSGRKSVHSDQMIGRDIGIYGSDGILILELVEEKFDLDLSPLVDTYTKYLSPTWWDRLRGRAHGPAVADLMVRDLVQYVMQHKGEGRKLLPRFI